CVRNTPNFDCAPIAHFQAAQSKLLPKEKGIAHLRAQLPFPVGAAIAQTDGAFAPLTGHGGGIAARLFRFPKQIPRSTVNSLLRVARHASRLVSGQHSAFHTNLTYTSASAATRPGAAPLVARLCAASRFNSKLSCEDRL